MWRQKTTIWGDTVCPWPYEQKEDEDLSITLPAAWSIINSKPGIVESQAQQKYEELSQGPQADKIMSPRFCP